MLQIAPEEALYLRWVCSEEPIEGEGGKTHLYLPSTENFENKDLRTSENMRTASIKGNHNESVLLQ